MNPFHVSKKENRAIIGKYVQKYLLIYTILMGIVACFEGALFIRGLIVFNPENHRAWVYLFSYVFLFVASLANGIFLFIGRFRQHRDISFTIAMRLYTPAILLWSLVISYLDMARGNAPIVYLTVLVTIAGMVILHPYFFDIITIVSFGGLIGLDASQGFLYFKTSAEYINIGVFIVMAILINARHYIVSLKDYRESHTLEKAVAHERKRVSDISLQTIMSISNAVDAKDKYTKAHSHRVASYSKAIAESLGWESDKAEELYQIALLHDIGKIGVPDDILNCPGKLSKEQYELMKTHTTIGGEILKDLTILKNVDLGAKYHHERFDGNGYPSGLKGYDIPLEARIIAVADAFDAMNSNRVYRNRLGKEDIVKELVEGKGKQFDPEIIDAFLPNALKLLEEEATEE